MASEEARRTSSSDPAWVPVAEGYCEALSQADAAGAEAVTTSAFWGRISPAFDGGPAPGAFGTITTQGLEQHGRSLRAGYVEVTALCAYPDGVEELVEITLKDVGGEWRVAGGFAP